MMARRFRWLAALLIRGPDAEFVKHDLNELYARDRARGVTASRAHWRYTRRLLHSAFSVWRADLPTRSGVEWIGEIRGGTMLQDLRFGTRLLRKRPTSAGIAVGGLALSIAVVASVFTLVDATILRSYAMDEPASVMSVSAHSHGWPYWPYAQMRRMQDEATLSRVEASLADRVRFNTAATNDGDSRRRILFVTGGYLSMLGGRPLLGRPLVASDDKVGAPLAIVVSHHFWSTALNADPSVVGKTMWLNGAAVTLVGVLRPDFTGPIRADLRPAVWAPLAALDDVLGGRPLDATSRTSVEVTVRLAPGVAPGAAQDELSAIVSRSNTQGSASAANAARPVRLQSAASPLDANAAESYLALAFFFGILGLVLAVACANTTNLLLAAATTRMPEMGVRLALGASTRRLVMQMVNESLMLGLIAGGLGLLLSVWFVPVLRALLELSPEVAIGPDGRAVLFTTAVALVCGLATGLSPARYGARGNVLAALRSQSANGSGTVVPSRLRTSFVGFQAAVSIFLLVAASLLARSAIRLTQTEIGFDVDRLLAVQVERKASAIDQGSYVRRLLAAVREVPSVERASVSQYQPFGHSLERHVFTHGGKTYQLNVTRSDADFFSTAGLRLRRGRTFTAKEVDDEAPVALISESVALAFFRGSEPVGQSLASIPSEDDPQEPATIVGVVGDALLTPLWSQVSGAIYRPIHRVSANPPNLIIRTATPGLTARAIEETLRRVDPTTRPMLSIVRDGLESFLGSNRMLASLSAPAAVLVLVLAVLGLFGVTAFVVSQRTSEVGVRLALGASSSDMVRLLVRDSLRPVIIGLVVGLAAALVASRASAHMIGGISPHDPLAIGGAAMTLLTCAFVAVITPARRAAKTDPASVLRQV